MLRNSPEVSALNLQTVGEMFDLRSNRNTVFHAFVVTLALWAILMTPHIVGTEEVGNLTYTVTALTVLFIFILCIVYATLATQLRKKMRQSVPEANFFKNSSIGEYSAVVARAVNQNKAAEDVSLNSSGAINEGALQRKAREDERANATETVVGTVVLTLAFGAIILSVLSLFGKKE